MSKMINMLLWIRICLCKSENSWVFRFRQKIIAELIQYVFQLDVVFFSLCITVEYLYRITVHLIIKQWHQYCLSFCLSNNSI